MEQFLHFAILLVGFVFILLAAHFTARWMGGKIGRFGSGKYFNIIDRISLGNECFIYLMSIGGNVYIVGVTKANMQVLDKVQESDFALVTPNEAPNAFTGVLYNYLNKRSDSHEKGRHEKHDQS
jgi:flagellar biogenesis protein FliO